MARCCWSSAWRHREAKHCQSPDDRRTRASSGPECRHLTVPRPLSGSQGRGVTLLKGKSSSAIVAVRDLDRARDFYSETLGLETADDDKGMIEFRTGETRLVIYVSEFAGSNKANAVVWSGGGDFNTIVDQLRDRGVTFEEYPDLGMKISNGVHSAGDFKAVWFRDPDGNVLHLTNM